MIFQPLFVNFNGENMNLPKVVVLIGAGISVESGGD